MKLKKKKWNEIKKKMQWALQQHTQNSVYKANKHSFIGLSFFSFTKYLKQASLD